jgi:hypothetical protein
MPRYTEKQVRAYISVVAEAMGLGDWRFYVRFEDIENNAEVTIENPESRQAAIRINTDLLKADREELRRCISHELMHCVLSPYANMAEGMVEHAIHGEIGEMMRHLLIIREEEVTHWFSRVMAHHLPLIGKA